MSTETTTTAPDFTTFNRACIALDFCMKDLQEWETQFSNVLADAAAVTHMDASFRPDGSLGGLGVMFNGDNHAERDANARTVKHMEWVATRLATARLRLVVAQREFKAALAAK
jgi:hypothetical protein